MDNQFIQQAKACSKCGVVKALTEFGKSSQTISGVRAACKLCCAEAQAARLRAQGVTCLHITLACEDCCSPFVRTATLRTRCDVCRAKRKQTLARAAGKRTYDKSPARVRCPEERRAANRRFAQRHPDKVLAASRRYNEVNRDEINRKARERYRTEKRRDYMRGWDKEYRSLPRNRLDQRMKTAVGLALKGGKGGRPWENLLGYSLGQLATHIERQFLPGMTWENIGEWHVDHIVPKSLFLYNEADDPEFRAAWALTNLRPLWAPDNLSKGAKRLLLL